MMNDVLTYRERLIKTIQEIGQEIIDTAEDILGENEQVKYLRISVDIPVGAGSNYEPPSIEVDREVYSKRYYDALMKGEL